MIDLPDFDAKIFIENVCDFIKEKVKNAHCTGVVLGLSGGIDSAVVAYLAVKALGSSNVRGYILPTKTTSQQDLDDAKLVQEKLKIEGESICIDEIHENIMKELSNEGQPDNNLALATSNVKPRLRMTILYYYATIYKSLVIGTGNKTELNVGYFTKHGDGGVDMLPIGDLYKEEVMAVAKELGVPEQIIEKPPTAGLLPNQTDEKELGMTYHVLDRLLYLYLDENNDEEEISKKLGLDITEVERIINLNKNSQHKRDTPPIFLK
ncbi:MAG TPA: NAD+ synthase [Methanosphaera sp.]|nr:NAD+ synthase [Methanosphaera sp.]HII08075.1 NAD+ synthase [Methanosphaera sp.]HIJ15054.1 NAD+ synthase [Methanosphaera sp.]